METDRRCREHVVIVEIRLNLLGAVARAVVVRVLFFYAEMHRREAWGQDSESSQTPALTAQAIAALVRLRAEARAYRISRFGVSGNSGVIHPQATVWSSWQLRDSSRNSLARRE